MIYFGYYLLVGALLATYDWISYAKKDFGHLGAGLAAKVFVGYCLAWPIFVFDAIKKLFTGKDP
jgi:hypothetical protein